MSNTPEQQAREILDRMDISGALSLSAGDVGELAQVIAERNTILLRYNKLKDMTVHIYNSGYNAGHHFTVEGGYVDIHSSDMDAYHAEEVAELLAALVGEEGR